MVEPPQRPAPILFVHYGDDWIRGSERCLLDLLTYLDRERFRPVLWCNGRSLAEEARKLDVAVETDSFTILLGWQAPRLDLANYRRLVRRARRLIEAHDVRLVHSNSVAPTQWLFPAVRGARLPLLTHIHAPYAERERFTSGLHQTNLAVGVTRGCVDALIEDGFPERRTAVIYNAVDTASWEEWDESGLRERLGIGPDDLVITQVGSLIPRKGHDILLRALVELREEHPHCHLVVVGDGPSRGSIEQLAEQLGLEGVVHFLGFVDCPPGVIFRDATDIAVSPSRLEGFGLTVIEAGAAGCAVVATATTGMTEILTDGVNGIIVPIEDGEQLRAALSRLAGDADLRRRFGNALQAEVRDRFSVARYVSDFEATYERLLAVPAAELGWWAARWRGQSGGYARWLAGVATRRVRRLIPGR